jgi:hypothetical protein
MKEIDLDSHIAELGKALFTSQSLFEDLAKQESHDVSITDLEYLRSKFHQPPPVHPDIDEGGLGLGTWMAACQYAIFELIYNFDVPPLDFLRTIAFGEYDWTQATALEVICRLHIAGKIPKQIIDEIDDQLGGMRNETHLYFAKSLLLRMKRDERFGSIIQQIQNAEFQDVIAKISAD